MTEPREVLEVTTTEYVVRLEINEQTNGYDVYRAMDKLERFESAGETPLSPPSLQRMSVEFSGGYLVFTSFMGRQSVPATRDES